MTCSSLKVVLYQSIHSALSFYRSIVTGLFVGINLRICFTVCIGLTLNSTKSCLSATASANVKFGHNFIHPVVRYTDVAAFKASAS